MNNRYWLKIALGIALVFTLGLAGMAGARRGKAEVKGFLTTAATRIPLEVANIQFRLDGRSLGRFSGLDISRDGAPGTRIALAVKLADLAQLEALKACALTTDEARHFNPGSTFRCALPAELADGRLAEAGSITFEPGGVTRPLMLPADIAARLRHADASRARVSIQSSGDQVQVKVTDRNGRKVVDVKAGQ